jgi:predicted regulator of Ras-like GTPase activity (Roadblock/LC7/MglB family)
MEHGKRYTKDERMEILRFRETHTFQVTSAKFGVSMMTLFRWSQQYGTKQEEIVREEKKMDMITRYGEDLNSEDKAKAAELAKMLEVLKYIKGVKAIALITEEGQLLTMIATKEVQDVDLNMIATATLSLGQRTSDQLFLGNMETVIIKSKKGIFFVIGAGPSLAITLLFGDQADLRHLFAEDFTVIERVKQAVRENFP